MSFADDLKAAKGAEAEPITVDVAVNDVLYAVEACRVHGTSWDAIVADAPAQSEGHFRFGFDPGKAAQLACSTYGRLLDGEGVEVESPDWAGLFDVISGSEIRSIAAAWWGLNENDPVQKILSLKKTLAGGASPA